jgi:hypothetical protein
MRLGKHCLGRLEPVSLLDVGRSGDAYHRDTFRSPSGWNYETMVTVRLWLIFHSLASITSIENAAYGKKRQIGLVHQ